MDMLDELIKKLHIDTLKIMKIDLLHCAYSPNLNSPNLNLLIMAIITEINNRK
jgi:hypothetical protein